MTSGDEVYTAARTALLDALEALGAHRGAITLVGAQAIYLRVGEADVAVADGEGVTMAIRGSSGLMSSTQVSGSLIALTSDLDRAMRSS